MAVRCDNPQPAVVVIDDDQDVREALSGLLQTVGLRAELFGSVQEFLSRQRPTRPACLVLDVRLPGRSGLDFYDDLVKAKANMPVVFISGHADVTMSVRAMKAGAAEFLTKPFRHQDLLEAIQLAIERDLVSRGEKNMVAAVQAKFDTLTQREREVMKLVVAGRLNKQVAAAMGISTATVKLHRGSVMRKMKSKSLAELVRAAEMLERTRLRA
jgi:FixJ family two-component response regulator